MSADDAVAVGTLVGRIVQTRNAEGNETTTKPRDSTSKTPKKHVTSHNNKVIVAKFQQSQTCMLFWSLFAYPIRQMIPAIIQTNPPQLRSTVVVTWA